MLLEGCSTDESMIFHDDVKQFQGIWRDTVFVDRNVYIKDLIIRDNSINYSLADIYTHVIFDTLSGTILLGNENTIVWDCISPIDNKHRKTFWNVISLSPYEMILHSELYGEHCYKRVYHTSVEDVYMQDTLLEMFQYRHYLPLLQDELIDKLGSFNRLSSDDGIAYFTHHPLFDRISFRPNYDNDTIYSYMLSVKYWDCCDSIISSSYVKLRDVNGVAVYIDCESLETSENVIITDKASSQITFIPIKDYDYWPNVSQYLGKNIQTFMDDFRDKYVYIYEKNENVYSFQSAIDSICTDIFAVVDSNGVIQQSGVCLLNKFKKQKEAQKELEKFALFLKKKYVLEKVEKDVNNNNVYLYYSYDKENRLSYEISLRLNQYTVSIAKMYEVMLNYKNFN